MIAVLLIAPSAQAGVGNGSFETGDFTGWSVRDRGAGSWFVYSGTTSPLNGIPVPPPPHGTFAAMTDMPAPGGHVLFRTIRIPEIKPRLSFIVYYQTTAPICIGNGLDHTGPCNQQYRVDLMRKGSDPFSVSKRRVLKNLFRTLPGDPSTLPPTTLSFDLKKHAGKTVVLRFAEVDNQTVLNAAVDRVKLKGKHRNNAPRGRCTTADICNG